VNAATAQKPPLGELVLDHVAHFVRDLAAAARLAESLGFVVSPESAHLAQGRPAGTSNRCIMLEEGYIEILAPTLDTPNAQHVRDRMARYHGVHLVCFGTPDAEGEHRRLGEHGFEPEPVVSLEREVEGGKARFKVVYVPPAKMPEGRIQYVEHLAPEQIWKPEHLKHKNGVLGLAAVYVAADDPADTAARWARFSGLIPRRDCDLVRLDSARGQVFIGKATPAPAIGGYALKCREPERFLARCKKAGLDVQGQAVMLPPALGGAWLITS
jgi:hypothetical protein